MIRKREARQREVARKRCAIYVRKSTTHGLDKDFSSLDAQREACEQYIASRAGDGWDRVDSVYEDGGFTGANIDRPGFQRLLADIDAGKIDVVVVYKLDRLSRSLLDFAHIMERFDASGAAFVSVTQNFSTADPMGRLVLNILMTFAEFEREMICARTRDKIRAARRRGKWTGGVTPFGYRLEGGALLPEPDTGDCVRRLFDHYLETFSANQVAAVLNRSDAPRPASSRFGWTKNAVLRVLTSPVYAGLLRVGDDELVDGEHEPLVPRETWRQVQDHLAGLRRGTVVRTGSNYILRGILRCAACGTRMIGATTRKGTKKYRYYRCLTRDKQDAAACPTGHLAAGPIEDGVTDALRRLLRTAGPTHDLVEEVNAQFDAERDSIRAEQTAVARRVAHLAADRHRLVTEAVDATSREMTRAVEDNDAATAAAEAERRALDERLERLSHQRDTRASVAEALQRIEEVWAVLTVENRARLLRAAIDEVKVNVKDGGFDVTFAPFLTRNEGDRRATN